MDHNAGCRINRARGLGKLRLEGHDGGRLNLVECVGHGFTYTCVVGRCMVPTPGVLPVVTEAFGDAPYALICDAGAYGRGEVEVGERDLRAASGGGRIA
jgi:hypothetical protein